MNHRNQKEVRIRYLEDAATNLANVDPIDTNVDNIDDIVSQLREDKEALVEEYHADMRELAVENYIVNNSEKIQTLYNTSSIDTKIAILDEIQDRIHANFDKYMPRKLSYDELESFVFTYIQENDFSQFEDIAIDQ